MDSSLRERPEIVGTPGKSPGPNLNNQEQSNISGRIIDSGNLGDKKRSRYGISKMNPGLGSSDSISSIVIEEEKHENEVVKIPW